MMRKAVADETCCLPGMMLSYLDHSLHREGRMEGEER